jgi:hypothetical protein
MLKPTGTLGMFFSDDTSEEGKTVVNSEYTIMFSYFILVRVRRFIAR